jgi:hypothetical protein
MVLNTMERDRVMQKENSRKVKKAPGVLRRFVMKYKTTLNEMLLAILNGKSTIALAAASVKGWQRAYLACFSVIGRWSYRIIICKS